MAIDMSSDTGSPPTRILVSREPEMDTELDMTWCCFFTMTSKPFDFHYLMSTTDLNTSGGVGMGVFNNSSFINPRIDSWKASGGISSNAKFDNVRLLNTGWHHMAAVKEAGSSGSEVNTRLYIDGELFLDDKAILFTKSNLAFTIGESGNRTWPGGIADCRWYTRILSPEEIRTIATQQGKDDISESLLMRYPLSELSAGQLIPIAAGSVKDIGPFGFHGQGVNITNSEYIESPIANSQQFTVDVPQGAV